MPQGLRVLVTRPAAQAAALEARLQQQGATTVLLPMFDIEPAGDEASHRRQLATARDADGWVFTSANAARRACALDTGPWPALFAIGAATAAALAALGHPGARVPARGSSSEDLLAREGLQQVGGCRFLVCTGEGGRDLLVPELRRRGATVERIDLYRRVAVDHAPEVVQSAVSQSEAIVCTSGESLERLHALVGPEQRATLLARLLVVPSPRVLELARRLGFAEVRAPDQTSDEALVECLFRPAGPKAEDSASA